MNLPKLIVIALVLSVAGWARAHNCNLNLRYIGVYFNTCPVNTLVEGVDARGTNGPFINTYVRCVQPQLICQPTVKKKK
jgi:hypothetical protein